MSPGVQSERASRNVKEVLQALHDKGFKLVIMTNQGDIGKATASKAKTVAEKKGENCQGIS